VLTRFFGTIFMRYRT